MSMNQVIASVIVMASAACVQASVVYQDSTFNNADWGFEIVRIGGSDGAASSSQSSTVGNPGSSRKTSLTSGTVAGAGITYAVNRFGTTQATRYDPSVSGAIAAMNVSMQVRFDSPPPSIFLVGVFAMVKQDSRIYVADLGPIFSNVGWSTFSFPSLPLSAFSQISGPTAPVDFSASGAPLRAGYALFLSDASQARTGDVYVDNFQFEIVSVPAPSVAALAMVGVTSMCRRRRTYYRA
jgi:hypothetical protein